MHAFVIWSLLTMDDLNFKHLALINVNSHYSIT